MIQAFFVAYAAALMTFSPEKIADFYKTPFTVYADQGTQTAQKEEEVMDFWKQGVKPYEKMNIAKATPKVLAEEKLSETLYTAKVNWTNYDKDGKVVGEETNFYILSKKKDALKIVGLVIMAEKKK